MKTNIKTIHEEKYGENDKTLGILLNESTTDTWNEGLIYIYREGMYIFFNSMIEMVDYLLYSDNRVRRAYINEESFDEYYDVEIDGKFTDCLQWIN